MAGFKIKHHFKLNQLEIKHQKLKLYKYSLKWIYVRNLTFNYVIKWLKFFKE